MSGQEKEPGSELVDTASDNRVDEELIALAPPPPSAKQAIFVLGVLAMTVVMMVWFFPEARFLAKAFSGPKALGDAPDIDVDTLSSHSYVSVNGLPMVNEKLIFNEGVKWFALSDTERKMFPLAGQPNLFVQWTVPDEHKVYKDPDGEPNHIAEPSFFEGHLVKRSDLGPNFDRLWVFFDCLEVHPVSRCKYCLGRDSMESCRDIFTCVERNTLDVCSQMITRSDEGLAQELAELDKGSNDSTNRQKQDELESLRTSIREQEAAVLSMQLEEISQRLDGYSRVAKDNKAKEISLLRTEALRLRLAELESHAKESVERVNALSQEEKENTKNNLKRLQELREAEPAKIVELKTLQSFIEIGDGLDSLGKRLSWVSEKLTSATENLEEVLGAWTPNPLEKDGKKILQGLGKMEQLLFNQTGESPKHIGDAGVEDSGVSQNDDASKPKLANIEAATNIPEEPNEGTQETIFKLGELKKRVEFLEEKVKAVPPTTVPEFDKWAISSKKLLHFCRGKSEDVCKAPKGLRNDEIISNLPKLEEMLADIQPGGEEVKSLGDRFSDEIDNLDIIRKNLKELEARSAVTAFEIVQPLNELSQNLEKAGNDPAKVEEVVKEFTRIKGIMLNKKVFSVQLRGVPQTLKAVETALDPAKISDLEVRTKKVGLGFEKEDWVLIDGEIPMDRIWVIFIYGILFDHGGGQYSQTLAVFGSLENLTSVVNTKEKEDSKITLELTMAGKLLLFAAAWELLFGRIFSYLGFYTGVGSEGPLAWLATSGIVSMIFIGIMSLSLAVPLGGRLVTSSRLPGIWWRAALFLISPTYLLVIFWSIFSSNLSPWLLLGGYLTCILSCFFLSVITATRRIGPTRRRTVLALGLMMMLQAFGWTVLDFVGVDFFDDLGAVAIRAYLVSEVLMIVVPVISFFAFFADSPRKLGQFIRRPHVPALVAALGITGLATAVAVHTYGDDSYMAQVSYLVLGVAVSVPGGFPLYLISVFFGALTIGCLFWNFGNWRSTNDSKRLGLGLALIWIAGLQPYRVYQFAMLLLGFLLVTRAMAGRPPTPKSDRDSLLSMMNDLDHDGATKGRNSD